MENVQHEDRWDEWEEFYSSWVVIASVGSMMMRILWVEYELELVADECIQIKIQMIVYESSTGFWWVLNTYSHGDRIRHVSLSLNDVWSGYLWLHLISLR